MINRKKLAGIATGMVASVCASTAVNAADTIKLGFAVPLTGEYAPYTSVQGAKCMAEIINNAGGVDGKPAFRTMQQNV